MPDPQADEGEHDDRRPRTIRDPAPLHTQPGEGSLAQIPHIPTHAHRSQPGAAAIDLSISSSPASGPGRRRVARSVIRYCTARATRTAAMDRSLMSETTSNDSWKK